jgi:hypothetical protein
VPSQPFVLPAADTFVRLKRLAIRLTHSAHARLRIDLGRGTALVAQKFLHVIERHPDVEQDCGDTRTHQVRRYALGDPRPLRRILDHPLDIPWCVFVRPIALEYVPLVSSCYNADARREQVQRDRFEQWTTIRERHAQGATLKDISRDLHLHYKTVLKYAHATECPHTKAHPRRQRLVAPYEPYVRARWTEGCRNGAQLSREIQAHGFCGSRVLVSICVAHLRRDEGLSLPWLPKLAQQKPVTPRDAVNLFLVRASERRAADTTTLNEVRSLHPECEHVFHVSERFIQMVRDQLAAAFDAWMTDAQASSIREVRQCARNLGNDEAAIRAALEHPWSPSQVEGQVHRLKLVKRSMYDSVGELLSCREQC